VRILALNSGSSSLKGALYQVSPAELDLLPPPDPLAKLDGADLEAFLRQVGKVDAVGHRFVHGGARYTAPAIVTAAVRDDLARSADMAPVHIAKELDVIARAASVLGEGVPQIAVFDTAFHQTLDPAAYTYAVPSSWPVRRFGFHGLSYQYSSRCVQGASRLLICHLGSGASLCAVREGKSVDTTMGFTPLEGLVMSTRSGTIDPGILLYLQRDKGFSVDDLDRILNRESGLWGLFGSGDLREVLRARDAGDPRAILTFDVYLHRLVREAGSLIAALGGLDALVFSGGVGENSAVVRAALCERLAFLGVRLDLEKNGSVTGDQAIHAAHSEVRVHVICAREDWELVRACARLLT
jgi:acetate kinase